MVGPVGEDEVVGFEEELGGGRGGDDDGRDGAEAGEHDRAVFAGQAVEVSVRVLA